PNRGNSPRCLLARTNEKERLMSQIARSFGLRVEALEDRSVPSAQPLAPSDLRIHLGPNVAAQVGDTWYLIGSDYRNGPPTLWRTDGTAAHTSRLLDDRTFAGLIYHDAEQIVSVGGTIYFTARLNEPLPPMTPDSAWVYTPTYTQLWKLDSATVYGVTQVTNVAGNVGNLKPAGDHFFYTVTPPYAALLQDPYDVQLWVVGPGPPTPFQVGPFSWGDGLPNFAGATAAGASFYFDVTVRSPDASTALWTSDGTAAGTRALTGPGTPYPDLAPLNRVGAGDKLFFTAFNGSGGGGLWVADGGKLSQIKAFNDAPARPRSSQLATDGTKAFFVSPGPDSTILGQ